MSKKISSEMTATLAKREAAHTLMTKWVSENASEVATALEGIVPFMADCSLADIQKYLNTVNLAFASIALEVIKARSEEGNMLCLPTDAHEMQTAVFELTSFSKSLRSMDMMIQKHVETPAFDMVAKAFYHDEIYG